MTVFTSLVVLEKTAIETQTQTRAKSNVITKPNEGQSKSHQNASMIVRKNMTMDMMQ